jgi:hypothetical protein
MNKTYRHELKYFINHNDLKILSEILGNTLQLDPHSGENRDYWIRSLYFDTIDNLDFYDKMSGTLKRKKIRLRIYDVNQQQVKLEIKNKVSDYIHKDIALISREDALELIRGNREVLLEHRHPVLQRVYYFMQRNFYRPCTMVEYEREAYISSLQDIRLTFDKNIRSEGTQFDLFGTHVPVTPVFDESTVVLEVKFNRFLPDWIKGILKNFKSERYAISKYCMGRNLFY